MVTGLPRLRHSGDKRQRSRLDDARTAPPAAGALLLIKGLLHHLPLRLRMLLR